MTTNAELVEKQDNVAIDEATGTPGLQIDGFMGCFSLVLAKRFSYYVFQVGWVNGRI